MIDIQNEQLIPLAEVPNRLPKRRGRRVHYSTVFRWIQQGANGKRLESCKIGGVRFTSVEALNRFCNEPHCDGFPERGPERQKAIAEAFAELDAEGV